MAGASAVLKKQIFYYSRILKTHFNDKKIPCQENVTAGLHVARQVRNVEF